MITALKWGELGDRQWYSLETLPRMATGRDS